MKFIIRYILKKTIKPFFVHFYLKSARNVRFNGLSMKVMPDVFHPGLFFSSKFLAHHISILPLEGDSVLDIGCGSGILSLVAAQQGADVTSIDINPEAIRNTLENASTNTLSLHAIESDLFEQVSGTFSYILVNPPYYPKNPENASDHAWYCGEGHRYFDQLFEQLPSHITPETTILMVLSEVCDLEKIEELACKHHFMLTREVSKNTIVERLDIFKITAISD